MTLEDLEHLMQQGEQCVKEMNTLADMFYKVGNSDGATEIRILAREFEKVAVGHALMRNVDASKR